MTDEELIKLWKEDIKSQEEPFFDAKLINEQLRKWSKMIHNSPCPTMIVTSNPNGTGDLFSRMMMAQPPEPIQFDVRFNYDIFNSP